MCNKIYYKILMVEVFHLKDIKPVFHWTKCSLFPLYSVSYCITPESDCHCTALLNIADLPQIHIYR